MNHRPKQTHSLNGTGKWCLEAPSGSLIAYIEYLKEAVNVSEEKISKLMSSPEAALAKSKVVMEFLMCCQDALAPDEFVFLCLKLAGFKYSGIQGVAESVSGSRLPIYRRIQTAKQRLLAHFLFNDNDQVQG